MRPKISHREFVSEVDSFSPMPSEDTNIEKLLIKLTKMESINKIVERVSEYKDILGTTEENVLHIFSNFPTLLSLNTNTVKNKFKIKDN